MKNIFQSRQSNQIQRQHFNIQSPPKLPGSPTFFNQNTFDRLSPQRQKFNLQQEQSGIDQGFNQQRTATFKQKKNQNSDDESSDKTIPDQLPIQSLRIETQRIQTSSDRLLEPQRQQCFERVLNKKHSIISEQGSDNLSLKEEFEDQQLPNNSPKKAHSESSQVSPSFSPKKVSRLRRLSALKPQRTPVDETLQENKSRWIIMPKNQIKFGWDMGLFLVLIYVTIFTPYKIGFVEDGDFPAWDVWDNIVDFIFIFDMVITFFCAYANDDNKIITNPKMIAINYIKGWFFVDLLSSFPFYLILDNTSQRFNSIARISKLPKIYRAIKMIKLARMIKLKELQYMKIINVNIGSERFFYACLLLLFSCHVVACLWFFIASFSEGEDWPYIQPNVSQFDQYIISIYWSVQTVLTVGYGDVQVKSWECRLFAIFWMILSVYVFSFAVGSLASVLDRMDQANQTYLQRVGVLKNIKKEFHITNSVFTKVKKALKTGKIGVSRNYNILLDDLPPSLRIELAYTMNKKLSDELLYFKGKPNTFIATIGPLLTPLKVGAHEYIFMTGDPAEEIYFVKSGKLAVVLPQYGNFKIVMIKPGSYFGEIDILFYGEKRKYTIMTTKKSEFYVLSRKHFKQIYLSQFREEGQQLISEAQIRKEMLKEAYNEALIYLEDQEEDSKMRKKFNLQPQQKFMKSINSISSRSVKSYIYGQQSDHTANQNKLDHVIQEEKDEDDQEKDHDGFFGYMDRSLLNKKITVLEKTIKEKDQIIQNIQQELDELMAEIHLKNLDALSEKLKINNDMEKDLQLRRDLKATNKLKQLSNIKSKSPKIKRQKTIKNYTYIRSDSVKFDESDIIDFENYDEVQQKEENYNEHGLKIIYSLPESRQNIDSQQKLSRFIITSSQLNDDEQEEEDNQQDLEDEINRSPNKQETKASHQTLDESPIKNFNEM